MPGSNDYFVAESQGRLGVLHLKPWQGVALAEMSYAHAVMDAIGAFESESKSVLLVNVPRGNFAPDRMESFWEVARQTPQDESLGSARFSRPTNVPLQVIRQENGVVQLLKLLQKTNLFKIIAVDGDVDFDLLGLLLAFDVRFCCRTTRFENRLLDRGATPGFGVLWFLVRHLGQPATIDLVLNQPSIDSQEALRLKLITHVADDGALTEAAMRFATDVAAKPGPVLQGLARATELLSLDFQTYLDQFGGGFTQLPPG